MTSETVLVTGAGGYLGGRLVAHLERENAFVVRSGSRVVADGAANAVSMGQLDDAKQLRTACEGVATVVHLAALNEIESARHPERAVDVNVNGTVRLLAAATAAGVRRFVFLSTAHVYGAPLEGHIDERQVTRPVHPYAITHRAAEDFVAAAGREGRIETVVLRLSNAVGAPANTKVERWTLLVNDLCRQAVTAGKMTLRSSGLARRDFIPMTDACSAIAHFIRLPGARLPTGPVNLGSGESLKVIDVVELIAERAVAVLGAKPAIERPEPALGEQSPELLYSVDTLRATGFLPHGSLQDEIDETLRFCARAATGEREAAPLPATGR